MNEDEDGLEVLGVASELTQGSPSGIWCEASILPLRLTRPPNPPPSC